MKRPIGVMRASLAEVDVTPVRSALAVMERYRVSGVPITKDGRLVGILTNRDLRFVSDRTIMIESVMTKDKLVTVPVGTTLEEAKKIFGAPPAAMKTPRLTPLPTAEAQALFLERFAKLTS